MICPFCKEEIKDGAIKCRHCGSMLNGSNISKPQIVECPFCKEDIVEGSLKCEHCGSSLDLKKASATRDQPSPYKKAITSSSSNQGWIGCIIGGALMMLSPVLPWATAIGGVFSVSGFDKLGVQAFIIILFGLGILYGGIKVKSGTGTATLALIFSLISLVDAYILWQALNEQVATTNIEGYQLGNIGIGFWIYLAGVVVSLISIFYTFKSK